MIELVNPKTHAVIPDPQVKAIFLFGSTSFVLKIDISSSLFLKVPSFLLINSVNGKFFDPSIFPLLSSFLGSDFNPKNRSLLLASTN